MSQKTAWGVLLSGVLLTLGCAGGDGNAPVLGAGSSSTNPDSSSSESDGATLVSDIAWTDFPGSPDTRRVYVDSSRPDDSLDGLSESTPKKTLAAGIALLRHGYPDWLLLKRGQVWQEPLGQWKKSGRSVAEPMLISSYGADAARPRLETGPSDGIFTSSGGGSPSRIDFVSLVGIHFKARTYGGVSEPSGVSWLMASDHFLVEDCCFERYHTNMIVQGYYGRHTNFTLKGSLLLDAYSNLATNFSQGLYLSGVDGMLIETNLFDHNGWNDQVPGGEETIFNHSVYVQNGNTGVTFRNNIIANADGVQVRPGGLVEDNLFLRTSIALLIGGGNHPDNGFNGVSATVQRNVILDGKDIDPANARGWGISLKGVNNATISRNLIAHCSLGHFPIPLELDARVFGDASDGCCDRNILLEQNVVYNWGGSVQIQGTPAQISGITFRQNDVQNWISPAFLVNHLNPSNNADPALISSAGNRFFSSTAASSAWMFAGGARSLSSWKGMMGDTTSTATSASYPNPGVGIADYNATLGGEFSMEDFLASARTQSRATWRRSLTANAANRYFRRQFGM